jgi:flagellin-like hook-associated protein FlgL
MSGGDPVLSAGVRQNLLSLQSTADLMAKTQNRLATGKRVNSALDNPSNFFTSQALAFRAGDLNSLLDAIGQGQKVLETADQGISAITKTIETMQATIRQARQDKSFKTASYPIDTAAVTAASIDTNAEARLLSFSGGSVGTTPVNVDVTTAQGTLTAATNYADLDFAEAGDTLNFKLALNGSATTTQITIENGTAANSLKITVGGTVTDNIAVVSEAAVTGAEMATALNTAFDAASLGITVTGATGSQLTFAADTATDGSTAEVEMSNLVVANGGAGAAITAANFGFTAGGVGVSAGGTQTIANVTARNVDQMVSVINANASLTGKIRASNDSGKLRIENLSTTDLSIVGVSGTDGEIDGTTGAANTATVAGNEIRRNLVAQFNELRDQLDKLADDASYNGINLLRGDKLKVTFNETGSSSIEIQARDSADNPTSINVATLGITLATVTEFDSDTLLDSRLDTLVNSLNTLRSQASKFGSNQTIVETRLDFTKKLITTLQTGADNLVLADTNEEGANMLALQTRQQLSTTALSLSSQADQAVLRLFG